MKRLLYPVLFAASCAAALAASPNRQQALDAMIAAERAFAKLATTANTREAFLTYLADDAVMFSNGPCNGKTLFASRPADESLLAWAPSFADVAASADFGYDTGPWHYSPKRSDEKPVRHGQFVTIWKKQPAGEWRVAFDTGLSHPAPENANLESQKYLTSVQGQTTPAPAIADSQKSLLAAELSLNAQLQKSGPAAYEKILSADARLLYRGQFPAIGREAFLLQRQKHSEKDTLGSYEGITGETARSGDLGYAYGWVRFQPPSPEKSEPRSANYLRIWKRENGTDWRLVLELTGPG